MPTYDYFCEKCSYHFEAFQKMSDEPLKSCPKCHTDALKRGFGGGNVGLHFKGSGFYITDYNKTSSVTPPEKPSGGSCGCNGPHSCS